MNPKLGKALKYIFSFSLAGVLLWFSFRNVDWKEFAAGLKQTRWVWVAVSMCIGLLSFVLRGLRWNMLLKPLDAGISRGRTIASVCVCHLSNCIIPASGEVVRSALVSTKKAGIDKTFGTIVLERAWDLVLISTVYLLVLLCNWGGAGSFFAGNIWQPLVGKIGGGAWLIVAGVLLLIAGAVFTVVRLKDRNSFCGKLFRLGKGIWQGIASVGKMHHKGWFLIYSVGIWACYWLMCVCIIHAFPAVGNLSLLDAVLLMAAGSLSSLVPAPGGFGTYHYFVTLTLSGLFGVPWETGIVYATLAHESQAITIMVSGLVSYLLLTLRRK
ncbi:MAG: flippase-like domain-containing protein [Bacteroidales bacterium]|nr:flippase-like domain-containing protein [Bacteroidales bacterium]